MRVFGSRLKELREDKNMSQRALSQATGISQAAIARWESDERAANIDELVVLVGYFGVTADYMLGLE